MSVISTSPGSKKASKEQTVAKMLWDDENLYVSWYAQDRNISASVTKRHGPVSKDDCVEIFISPNPDEGEELLYVRDQRDRHDAESSPDGLVRRTPTWEPDGVRYRTSFHGLAKKEESEGRRHWIVEAAIPLKNFARDAEHTPPHDGDRLAAQSSAAGWNYECAGEYVVASAGRDSKLSYTRCFRLCAVPEQAAQASPNTAAAWRPSEAVPARTRNL